MVALFNGIAELDLGEEVSAIVTTEYYQNLLNELLALGNGVVLLTEEITSDQADPPVSERIDVQKDIASDVLANFRRHAQAGYRMAILLSDAEHGIRLLESRGYERCTITSPGSAAVVQGWEAWLARHLPDVNGALVFGHDFEPAFIFERN